MTESNTLYNQSTPKSTMRSISQSATKMKPQIPFYKKRNVKGKKERNFYLNAPDQEQCNWKYQIYILHSKNEFIL